MKAEFNGVVIAESEETVVVEGNHYFPPDSIRSEYFSDHARTTVCGWKGTATYFTVTVGGEAAEAVAWTYTTPKEAAAEIKDHLAFYPQVTVR